MEAIQAIQIWHVTRASGLVAYVLLTVAIIAGLYMQIGKQKGTPLGITPFIHETTAHWAMYLTIFHTVILLFDTYVDLAWYEIFVPFLSNYHTVSLGLGIMGLYGFVLLFLTTDFRSFFGAAFRRTVHLLSPIIYVVSTFHGIFLGSDTGYLPIQAMYILSAVVSCFLVICRYSFTLPSISVDKR